jgi:hypothetical protein
LPIFLFNGIIIIEKGYDLMKEILINVSKETRMVDLNKSVIGNDGENLQGKLVFTFIDEFVNGQARLEYEIKGNKNYVVLDKENNTYTIPVKNVLTKEGQIDMQLVITEGTDEEEIPVFKSNKFYLFCNSSINAVDEAPDGYELWIEQANIKLNEIDNLDIDIQDNVVTITKKDGTVKSENVKGDAYVITDEDLDEIETNVKSDIQPILENIQETADNAESIAKGANQSLSFGDYATMINIFNSLNNDIYKRGQNILIVTLNVPDLWISEVLQESINYTYSTDEDFTNLLKEQGYVQVGYYKLSALETQKVDLSDYAKKEQFVTLTQEEYDALTEKSANTYYFIPEQEE